MTISELQSTRIRALICNSPENRSRQGHQHKTALNCLDSGPQCLVKVACFSSLLCEVFCSMPKRIDSLASKRRLQRAKPAHLSAGFRRARQKSGIIRLQQLAGTPLLGNCGLFDFRGTHHAVPQISTFGPSARRKKGNSRSTAQDSTKNKKTLSQKRQEC